MSRTENSLADLQRTLKEGQGCFIIFLLGVEQGQIMEGLCQVSVYLVIGLFADLDRLAEEVFGFLVLALSHPQEC